MILLGYIFHETQVVYSLTLLGRQRRHLQAVKVRRQLMLLEFPNAIAPLTVLRQKLAKLRQ